MQGGGALGAYDAGVYNVIYYWINKGIKKENEKNKNIFDVIAGTSSGAINGAIITSNVVEKNGNWNDTPSQIFNFWQYLSSTPDLSNWWPFWFNFPFSWNEKLWMNTWQERHNSNSNAATGESARRFYSTKEYILNGAPNVFSKTKLIYDDKFFDDYPNIPNNSWFRSDNKALKESIKKHVNFPISTSYESKQPRLITVSVDVEAAEIVSFDSYSKDKEDITRNTKYENIYQEIKYDNGLMIEHIIASASVPIHYDYTYVPVNYDYTKSEKEKEDDIERDLQLVNLKDHRRFWDGGIASNTPLRELIQSHKDHWKNVKEKDVPDLEVYVVDVWPSMEKNNNKSDFTNYDSVINRKNELAYQDKTLYDEKVANIVSDYYNLTKALIDLVESKEDISKELVKILNTNIKSIHRDGTKRTNKDLLDDRFNITKIIRIERSIDSDDVANKWCDFHLLPYQNYSHKGLTIH